MILSGNRSRRENFDDAEKQIMKIIYKVCVEKKEVGLEKGLHTIISYISS